MLNIGVDIGVDLKTYDRLHIGIPFQSTWSDGTERKERKRRYPENQQPMIWVEYGIE
jgi:hypothetical protein